VRPNGTLTEGKDRVNALEAERPVSSSPFGSAPFLVHRDEPPVSRHLWISKSPVARFDEFEFAGGSTSGQRNYAPEAVVDLRVARYNDLIPFAPVTPEILP
jgi:hypothetical protein